MWEDFKGQQRSTFADLKEEIRARNQAVCYYNTQGFHQN